MIKADTKFCLVAVTGELPVSPQTPINNRDNCGCRTFAVLPQSQRN